jgi:hypothetical protein
MLLLLLVLLIDNDVDENGAALGLPVCRVHSSYYLRKNWQPSYKVVLFFCWSLNVIPSGSIWQLTSNVPTWYSGTLDTVYEKNNCCLISVRMGGWIWMDDGWGKGIANARQHNKHFGYKCSNRVKRLRPEKEHLHYNTWVIPTLTSSSREHGAPIIIAISPQII